MLIINNIDEFIAEMKRMVLSAIFKTDKVDINESKLDEIDIKELIEKYTTKMYNKITGETIIAFVGDNPDDHNQAAELFDKLFNDLIERSTTNALMELVDKGFVELYFDPEKNDFVFSEKKE